MKSKVKIIILAILGAILVAGGLIFFLITGQKQKGTANPIVENENGDTLNQPNPPTEPTAVPLTKSLIWKDEAGFTFQYGENIKINSNSEDQVNYSNLDLTISDVTGGIKILASDSKYKTLEDWVKKDPKAIGGSAIDIPLGQNMAKKVIFEKTGRIIVGLIDQGILFTIELTPDPEGNFQKSFDQIVSSFTLVYPTPAAGSPSTGKPSGAGSGDIIEEEEIVE